MRLVFANSPFSDVCSFSNMLMLLIIFQHPGSKDNFMELEPTLSTSNGFLRSFKELLSPHDMKRLEAYTNNLAGFHLVRSLDNS